MTTTSNLPFEKGHYYTRQRVREILGKVWPNMNFLRWENPEKYGLKHFKVKLIPHKRGGNKWTQVEYEGSNLNEFFGFYLSKTA